MQSFMRSGQSNADPVSPAPPPAWTQTRRLLGRPIDTSQISHKPKMITRKNLS